MKIFCLAWVYLQVEYGLKMTSCVIWLFYDPLIKEENKTLIFTGPSGEPWLVVEFMCFGDLAEILRTNSGVLSLQRSDSPVLEMVV